jgi:hypothetical protein
VQARGRQLSHEGQGAQWDLHHRRICKLFNAYTSSPMFCTLDEFSKVDAMLLSHVMAMLSLSESGVEAKDVRDLESFSTLRPSQVFMDLLPSDDPTVLPAAVGTPELARGVHARFKNNNFVVHSHLNPGYAHGVFPLASRFLNHSCTPNAAPRFVLEPAKPPRMEIVALHQIRAGEEVGTHSDTCSDPDIDIQLQITIPYLDPATPYRDRASLLQSNYGFVCRCDLCETSRARWPDEAHIPPPPSSATGLRSFGQTLRSFVFDSSDRARDVSLFKELPEALNPAMHPLYLPALSEAFSKSSHEGPLVDALNVGRTLLALYRIIYPANFPMIGQCISNLSPSVRGAQSTRPGLHALELAKVAWNAYCVGPDATADVTRAAYEEKMIQRVHEYHALAKEILNNFGEEGDEGGPLAELDALSLAVDEGR